MDQATAKILTQNKSMAGGMVITWFLGGIGVFNVSILGGLVLGGLEIALWIITFMTLGLGTILLIPLHIVALIWTYIGIKRHNAKLIAALSDSAPLTAAVAGSG